jgi:hypothetical protein
VDPLPKAQMCMRENDVRQSRANGKWGLGFSGLLWRTALLVRPIGFSQGLVSADGIEPSTTELKVPCSTAELRAPSVQRLAHHTIEPGQYHRDLALSNFSVMIDDRIVNGCSHRLPVSGFYTWLTLSINAAGDAASAA